MSTAVDRPSELEILRRSLAMLRPGAPASLSREEAIRLITEVADLQARLERLRLGLRRLVEEAGEPASNPRSGSHLYRINPISD